MQMEKNVTSDEFLQKKLFLFCPQRFVLWAAICFYTFSALLYKKKDTVILR